MSALRVFVCLLPTLHSSAALASDTRACRTRYGAPALSLAGQVVERAPYLRAEAGGEHFALYVDETGAFGGDLCSIPALGDQALLDLVEVYRADTDQQSEFVAVFAASPLNCGDIFYLPLANDIRGIGYQHDDPREVYDETPNDDLEGILFLNDAPYWEENSDEFQGTFNEELGHRWGTLVFADLGDGPSPELLGREGAHWSYFVNTDASPMDGNRWTDNEDGTFTTATEPDAFAFNPMDLYLMGLIPPEEVPTTFVLRKADTSGLLDCFRRTLTASSPPQFCDPITLAADSAQVSLDDIIEVEGERDPAQADAPSEFRISYAVVARDEDLCEGPALCQRLDALIERATLGFEQGTGALATLDVVTQSMGTCAEWTRFESNCGRQEGCGCALGAGKPASAGLPAYLLLVLLVLARCASSTIRMG